MAAGFSSVNLELQHTDTYPLLMDHNALPPKQEDSGSVMLDTLGSSKSSHSDGMPSSPRGNAVISIDPPTTSTSTSTQTNQLLPAPNSLRSSVSASSRSPLFSTGSFSHMSRSSRQNSNDNGQGVQQQTNPSNSGLWILLDMTITVAQIVASVIVLSLSWGDENPRAPLALWVMGYAGGCLAMLPFLYWRYKRRHARQQEHDALASSSASSTSAPSSPGTLPLQTSQHIDDLEGGSPAVTGSAVQNRREWRSGVHMERFKIALDCFFAVWFVIGNVWIFGGHTSAHDAPNLYRLCIIFLAFSCISYAMPFIICATVCCCLPCIITLLSYREEHTQVKGAAPEVIAGLPIYKFKIQESNGKTYKEGNDSDCESQGEGGIFAPGTEKERLVSSEDAVCCICLGQYKDGVNLKELHCGHFFHVECVDKWLKINATCPLCKHELSVSTGEVQPEQLT